MQTISPESPEARRKRLAKAKALLGKEYARVKPGTRAFEVVKRVAVGVYSDGFIHAGNLAYLALMTLFPFVIVAAAVARLVGEAQGGMNTVVALLQTMPPNVAEVLRKPISDVLQARSGNLLWLGALVGLWTTGSFVETIRDIIRRAYGVAYSRPFWEYRLGSMGLIFASVFLILIAFALSIALSSAQEFLLDAWPGGEELAGLFSLLRFAPALILFGSLYLLFVSLTPKRYRKKGCKKWPGPAFVTVWWLATTSLLPVVLSSLGSYDLTYGSLAGVIIALFFFFMIGLGVTIGAQLNAALAEPPEPTVQDIREAKAEDVAEEAAEASRDASVGEEETE
ncbi:MAG: Ribonuclease BN [uncultured Sphingosinicella sp.]|uniref:Ribonuclease BN n=1 Tax=uncultured Sphingosinicella sp. TaxID=478748 RepID=A0A6J4UB43_9SPHN|nr:YihY/virulence factor BrkB family protein [uncultured Sphingosinicella sp.]CAA9545249.1 MAG: Ribonuclease BN [uncultured Sphingosinicella sp.]